LPRNEVHDQHPAAGWGDEVTDEGYTAARSKQP
jgi:hypothetical protein